MGRPASQADQGASVGALLQGEAGASQDPHLGACPPAVQGASCLVRWRYTDPQRRDGACPRPCGRRQRGPDPRPECCSQDPGHREERAPAPLSSASLVPAASAWSQVSAAVPSGQDHLHPPPGTYTSRPLPLLPPHPSHARPPAQPSQTPTDPDRQTGVRLRFLAARSTVSKGHAPPAPTAWHSPRPPRTHCPARGSCCCTPRAQEQACRKTGT